MDKGEDHAIPGDTDPRPIAAGGRHLARGGALTVYEDSWSPPRIVLLESPSQRAWESFYYGPEYEG